MVQIANPSGNFSVLNGSTPCEGTKAYPFNLDFTANSAYLVDLTQQYQQKQFTTLQTVWIDNKDNDNDLEIICGTTSQRIIAPGGTQGFYAMLQPSPPKFTVQTSGSLIVNIALLNFYIPPVVWTDIPLSAGGLPQVDVPALDAVISGGKVQVASNPYTVTGMVDASGVIAAGGVWQAVFAVNAVRKRFILSNPDTATETLYFRINGGGAIPMFPGGGWDESGSSIDGDLIELMAVTIGHAFTAYSK